MDGADNLDLGGGVVNKDGCCGGGGGEGCVDTDPKKGGMSG